MKTTCASEMTVGRLLLNLAPRRPVTPSTSREVVDIEEGQIASWKSRRRCTFLVLQGTVWLTSESEMADLLVSAGESMTLEAPGKVIAQSLTGRARIAIVR